MRIAYFSEALPPTINDGVTRTLAQLVDTLLAEQVEFRFVSGIKPDSQLGWREHVHSVVSLPFLPYRYYRFAVPYFQRIDRILDRFGPDLVHAVNPTLLGIYAQEYARRRGIPVVSSYHTRFVSYFPYYGLARWQGAGWGFLSWFYNRCAMTFAPSSAAAAELGDHGVRSVDLWTRGIDTERFGPRYRDIALRRHIAPGGAPILLFVGRLVREKDLDVLAEAIEILSTRGQWFVPAFVGDGPLRPELERRLPDAVFAGYQSGADLSRWYASADLFVFPSTTETFGNVILEAFASGLPAVGARAGGVQDLIQSGHNGLLVPPRSSTDLANAIESILRNRQFAARLGAGALETAAQYRWPAVNKRLLASYERALSGRCGRGAPSLSPWESTHDGYTIADRSPRPLHEIRYRWRHAAAPAGDEGLIHPP
jgi:glycosyltransferase involved in cell wall biosynthesis